MTERQAKFLAFDFLVSALVLSVISVLFPVFFQETITVSPLVLFGIIFFSAISNSFVNDDPSNRVFTLRFFMRLAICGTFSLFLILIPTIVRLIT